MFSLSHESQLCMSSRFDAIHPLMNQTGQKPVIFLVWGTDIMINQEHSEMFQNNVWQPHNIFQIYFNMK